MGSGEIGGRACVYLAVFPTSPDPGHHVRSGPAALDHRSRPL
jgi:hypothetical protein